MGTQHYEYRVDAVSIYPTEIDGDRFEKLLNDAAADGWELNETTVIGDASVLFVFRRET